MLVTFSCEEYGNITLFGDVAKRLLTLMGQSAAIPGALLARDVPEALSHLKKAVEQDKLKNPKQPKNQQNDEEEEPISLAQRALPLINMLETAQRKQCNVTWSA